MFVIHFVHLATHTNCQCRLVDVGVSSLSPLWQRPTGAVSVIWESHGRCLLFLIVTGRKCKHVALCDVCHSFCQCFDAFVMVTVQCRSFVIVLCVFLRISWLRCNVGPF